MSIGSKSFHLQYLKVVVFHAKNEHTQKGFFLFCEYWHNDEQTKIGTIVKKATFNLLRYRNNSIIKVVDFCLKENHFQKYWANLSYVGNSQNTLLNVDRCSI